MVRADRFLRFQFLALSHVAVASSPSFNISPSTPSPSRHLLPRRVSLRWSLSLRLCPRVSLFKALSYLARAFCIEHRSSKSPLAGLARRYHPPEVFYQSFDTSRLFPTLIVVDICALGATVVQVARSPDTRFQSRLK